MLRQFPRPAVVPASGRRKSADYCRQRARECQEQAAQAVDPHSRELLEQMAANWLSLVRATEAGAAPFLTEMGQKIG